MRTLKTRVAAFGIAALSAVAMQVSSSGQAQAAGPASSRTNTYGTLTVSPNVTGYAVSFVPKVSGTYDFHLFCRNGSWLGDNGAFRATAGGHYSYKFYTGGNSKGGCQAQLLNSSGKVILESGYTTL